MPAACSSVFMWLFASSCSVVAMPWRRHIKAHMLAGLLKCCPASRLWFLASLCLLVRAAALQLGITVRAAPYFVNH